MLTKPCITTKPASLYLCSTFNTLIMHHCHDIHHMCFLFIFIVYSFFLLFTENVQTCWGICMQCMHKNHACICFLFYSFIFCLLICDITTSCHFLTSHVITTSHQQMAAAVGAVLFIAIFILPPL